MKSLYINLRQMLLSHPFKMISFCIVMAASLSDCRNRNHSSCTSSSGLSKSTLSGISLTSKNLVLTFEDISEDSWKEISNLLNTSGISATYFLSGKDIEANNAKVSYLTSQGHAIGTTGWSGNDLSSASDPTSELRRSDFELSKVNSSGVFLVRSNLGMNQQTIDDLTFSGLGKYIGSIGMDIGWAKQNLTDDKKCWESNLGVEQCLDLYITEIRNQTKGIVNFRSSSNKTFLLLRTLISQLKSEGFTFTKLDLVPEIAAKITNQKSTSGGRQCNEYK